MTLASAAKKRYAVAKSLSYALGESPARLFADAMWCSNAHGASGENYYVLRMFSLPEKARRDFLTAGRSKAADSLLNAQATPEDKKTLANKALFNRAFTSINSRRFIYAPQAQDKELESFLDNNESFFLKPTGLTQGQGILKISSGEIGSLGDFMAQCRRKKLLLEQVIPQHPQLEKISPGCLNSLRLNAARDAGGAVRIIGAALRCGGVGAHVDNFHSGGVAYTVDVSAAQVAAPGRDNKTLCSYVNHPGSFTHMPGLEIPHFDKALDAVYQAMALVPSMGYVGWDLAITPQGVEIIEGNFSYPGGNIIQFDGVGKYPLVLRCIAGR